MPSDPNPAVIYLQEAVRRAEEARAELDIELRGLRLALARLNQERSEPRPEPVEESVSPEVRQWRELPRTEAVERMLARSGGEMHRKELTEQLRQVGRNDNIDAVSAALAYMARGSEPRVESMGSGRWRLLQPTTGERVAASNNGSDPAHSEEAQQT